MNSNLKAVIRATAITTLVFIGINFMFFLLELYAVTPLDDWTVKFKHGSFFLNEVSTGFPFATVKASLIILILFISLLVREHQAGNIQLKPKIK